MDPNAGLFPRTKSSQSKSKGSKQSKSKGSKQSKSSSSRLQRNINIMWLIIQKLVADLTDSKKRIYKKDVYDAKYADTTQSRKPKANAIKQTIKESKESAVADMIREIDKKTSITGNNSNNELAAWIYTDYNYLVKNIMSRDGFADRIFTDRLFRAYDGEDLIAEAKREKKEQKRKTQDETQYRGALGRLGTQMRNIYKQDEKERKTDEIKRQLEEDRKANEEYNFDDDDYELSIREKKLMKREEDIRLGSKAKSIPAAQLTKAKVFITKNLKDKFTKELSLDNKEKDKTQRAEEALLIINVSEDVSFLDLSRYLTVLLNFATEGGVSAAVLSNIQQALLNNYNSIVRVREEKRAESNRQDVLMKAEEKRLIDEKIKQKEDTIKKSRTEYTKEEYKQDDTEPRLTFAGVTLREREWKLLLNIASKTVDDTLTPNQKRLNNMRLNGQLKQFAERNETNTPSVQSGLMEYKESLTSRDPGVSQRVFRPDTNVKTTTQFGYMAQSMGMISNQLQDVKQEVTNADIKAEEREARASEERYQLYESTMQANNDIERVITNLRDGGIDPRYLNNVETKLKQNLPRRRETKDMLSPSQRGIIIQSMPAQIRDVLSPMVDNLLTGNVNMSVLVAGLVGLGFISVTGSSFGAQAIQLATGYLLNAFGINLNDYLYVNNILPPPATIITPPRGAPPPITQLPLERKRIVTRDELKRSVDGKLNYRRQTYDIRNLGSESDVDDEFVEIVSNVLVDNTIDELGDIKMTESERVQLAQQARKYIIQQVSILGYAMSDQMAGRTRIPKDMGGGIFDFIPELESPIGFFDYIRNIGGLPQAIMRNLPDIKLNDLRQALPTLTEIKSGIPGIPYMRGKQPDLIEVLGPDGKPVPDKGILVDMKDKLENIDRKNFPSLDEIKEGAYNAVGAGIVPAIVRGGAMGAIGGIPAAGLGGAATGAVTGPMIRRYYEQQGADMSDPEVQSHIKKIQALPPAIAGALIGAAGYGQNIFSGAGVTERKLTVDPSVLAETMATEQQDTKQTKKWITKAIFPTPDILDETRQEKFVDDLEFAAFNYIEPTSQGATGTVRTNPLKRSQFLSDQIRYMDAGISMPSMLYNKEFPTNTNQQQLDTYKLGQDMLPVMEFMEQDNADTFTPIGRHYVNNQDIAVEMFSPFSDYSDNRNYWAINERSKLYNLYA